MRDVPTLYADEFIHRSERSDEQGDDQGDERARGRRKRERFEFKVGPSPRALVKRNIPSLLRDHERGSSEDFRRASRLVSTSDIACPN